MNNKLLEKLFGLVHIELLSWIAFVILFKGNL